MKRLLLLILLLILSPVIYGCGGEKTELETPPTEKQEITSPEEETEPEPPKELNPLTGEPLEQGSHLIAVMVNNAPKARPQTGLAHGDLVYEMEMEGAMTRFLAFFHGEMPENIGSVRSARPYVMMLAKEWDAYFAHVGGSVDAYAKIKEWKIKNIDDMTGHPGYWVDKTGSRPHNTYLNLEKALAGKPENGLFHDWQFVDPTPGEPDYRKISFAYDRYNRPDYVFDKESGYYLRSINGKPHVDKDTGEQLKARNIIFQYAKHRDLKNEFLHIEISLIGEGKAEYFLGGKYQTGTWRKKDLNSPTEYLDGEGKPIELARGKTWVQVMRTGKEITKE